MNWNSILWILAGLACTVSLLGAGLLWAVLYLAKRADEQNYDKDDVS